MTDELDQRDGFEYEERSASTNTALGLSAFGAVAPFVAPYVHDVVDKLTGANEPPP